MARCKEKAEKDGKLTRDKQKLIAQGYASRSLELLARAIQNGFQDKPRLEKDASFKALKDDAGFQKLLAKLKDKPGATSP